MKINAIRIHQFGGPEVMKLEEIDLPEPGPGEVRVRHKAIGINFIETYHRSGLYPLPLPARLGQEAAGVIEAIGEGVTGWKTGDRVAYMGAGAYAEANNTPAAKLVRLPDSISFEQGAAVLLKGLTAWMLVKPIAKLKSGDWVLIHAAAGGMGSLLCQWAKSLGVHVIGTTGSPAKAAKARALGCEYVLDTTAPDLAAKVKEAVKEGVHVVIDGVGKDTFLPSLDCIRPTGLMISYGNASGPPPAIEPLLLMQKGSLFLTRPTSFHYLTPPGALEAAAKELFAVLSSGAVKIEIGQSFKLADVKSAHEALASRKTVGATVLTM